MLLHGVTGGATKETSTRGTVVRCSDGGKDPSSPMSNTSTTTYGSGYTCGSVGCSCCECSGRSTHGALDLSPYPGTGPHGPT